MTEKGIAPLIDLVGKESREIVATAIYALGSLCENDDVKSKIVELGGVRAVIAKIGDADIEMKRASAYFLANICEQIEFHPGIYVVYMWYIWGIYEVYGIYIHYTHYTHSPPYSHYTQSLSVNSLSNRSLSWR